MIIVKKLTTTLIPYGFKIKTPKYLMNSGFVMTTYVLLVLKLNLNYLMLNTNVFNKMLPKTNMTLNMTSMMTVLKKKKELMMINYNKT